MKVTYHVESGAIALVLEREEIELMDLLVFGSVSRAGAEYRRAEESVRV